MLVGYARVSTKDQNLDLQLDALEKAGCKEIFDDHASGAAAHRGGLEDCLNFIREGDTLIVWKIDRLGRSISKLLKLIEELHERKINFRSLTEPFDTTSPFGKAMFAMIAALTQMERDLIIERTTAGLEAARARGMKPGTKPIIVGDVERNVLDMHNRGYTPAQIAAATRLDRATVYRYFKRKRDAEASQPQPATEQKKKGRK